MHALRLPYRALADPRRHFNRLESRTQSNIYALMSKTYPELKTEVARLAAKAERVRAYELPTVVAEVNLLIERCQLTEAMIFGNARLGR